MESNKGECFLSIQNIKIYPEMLQAVVRSKRNSYETTQSNLSLY